MKQKVLMLFSIFLLVFVLCGCSAGKAVVQETVPVMTSVSISAEAVLPHPEVSEVTSIPSEVPTEQPTVPPTEPPTELSTEPPTELSTEPPTEPEPEAQLITERLRVLIGGVNYTAYLCDGHYGTSKSFPNNQSLTLECDAQFSGIYFDWNWVPGPYEIVWDGGAVECGEQGFLHEYVRLPEPVSQITVRFHNDENHSLSNVRVYTDGAPPKDVQVWLPPCEEADILVFPTHSDDDALFFGALISYYAIERDLCIQTAFMVDHHGYPQRDHERLNGLWEMGVRHYPILGKAPDTMEDNLSFALTFYETSNIEQWQVEQIRRFKPLVVVGHDLRGEYGNGGHKVNAYYLVQAVESAADEEKYPDSAQQYGIWNAPKLYLHLYEENEIVLDVNTPLQNDPAGRTPFEIARAAYRHHWSQQHCSYQVRQDGSRMYDCRFFGLYRTLVDGDTVPDIMDNISAEYWRSTNANAAD